MRLGARTGRGAELAAGQEAAADVAACRRQMEARVVEGEANPIDSLAEAARVGPESVRRLLRGEVPSVATTLRISAALIGPPDQGDAPCGFSIRRGPNRPGGKSGHA